MSFVLFDDNIEKKIKRSVHRVVQKEVDRLIYCIRERNRVYCRESHDDKTGVPLSTD